ncbi:MAG TPA: 16S rRNA (cytidine(1402)-2'-O)-methyltransferase [Porticoccaceae bacterium]|nr:16S rRNA (cytidine(1402)-2'-O)-methyltransferase [Porticoccaceae bacterium]|tara:strand:- start:328 stop:1173 length:846 start_codon:yes stop_codon:yes gene_type:complete
MTLHPCGILYIVATPIGNLGDLSLRAIETLQSADIIACEDTRHSKKLLEHYHIKSPTVSYHEYSDRSSVDKILSHLERNQSVALISDAGTPLISDPGYRLVVEARERGIDVVPIPGSCALVAALSVSGLATDRFSFQGFLPAKKQQRTVTLKALRGSVSTLIFYEAPHRLLATLDDAVAVMGIARNAFMAREITKKYETFNRGTLGELREVVALDSQQQRGEIVLIIAGAVDEYDAKYLDAERILAVLLNELPPSKAASLASKITGLSKQELYTKALSLAD